MQFFFGTDGNQKHNFLRLCITVTVELIECLPAKICDR